MRVAPDLSEARVYAHSEFQTSKLIPKLNALAKVFQREIAHAMTQKRMPRLIFVLDTAAISARRIEELLEEDAQRKDWK